MTSYSLWGGSFHALCSCVSAWARVNDCPAVTAKICHLFFHVCVSPAGKRSSKLGRSLRLFLARHVFRESKLLAWVFFLNSVFKWMDAGVLLQACLSWLGLNTCNKQAGSGEWSSECAALPFGAPVSTCVCDRLVKLDFGRPRAAMDRWGRNCMEDFLQQFDLNYSQIKPQSDLMLKLIWLYVFFYVYIWQVVIWHMLKWLFALFFLLFYHKYFELLVFMCFPTVRPFQKYYISYFASVQFSYQSGSSRLGFWGPCHIFNIIMSNNER